MNGRENQTPLWLALILSVLLHLAGLHLYSPSFAVAGEEKIRIIELVQLPRPIEPQTQTDLKAEKTKSEEVKPTVTKEEKSAVVEVKPAEKRPEPPPPPEPKPEKKVVKPTPPPKVPGSSAQIVDLGPPEKNDQTPEKARYLAERDMKTEKETVRPSQARTGSPNRPPQRFEKDQPPPSEPGQKKPEREAERKGSKSPPSATGKKDRPSLKGEDKKGEGQKRAPANQETPRPISEEGLAKPRELARADLKRPEEKKGEGKKEDPAEKSGEQGSAGEKGSGKGRPGKRNLMVTMSDLGKGEDADSGSVDYLPNTPRGEVTSLNAKQYTYAEFYNRIKKIVRFYWDPEPALRMIHWNGATLETRLRVVISAEGNLESVEVFRSCGYPVVDAAAVTAVRKAAPFFNVPPGLLNEKGVLEDIWAFFIHS